VFVKYAKLWQMQHGLPHPHAQIIPSPEADEILRLKVFRGPADPNGSTHADVSMGAVDERIDGSHGRPWRRAA
jgi:hypothetical protein